MFLDLKEKKKGGLLAWGCFMPAYLSIVSIVGYSRMFNGVHSLDQVIYGGLIGVWIAGMGHQCIRDRLYTHIDKLNSEFKKGLRVATLWFVLSIGTCLASYYFCVHTFEVPALWLARQTKKSGDPGLFTLANSSCI